jgi:16S rRNA (guanine527-N7)-methyltransferase
MESARMIELLRPFTGECQLAPAQVEKLQDYVALLMRWNARTNLTAIRDEESIVTRHIAESLFAARQLVPDPATAISVIDLGSGAGFPGLPLKIHAPAIDLILVESQNKKATFLKEAIRTMHLEGARVFADRGEKLDATADLVTMRAVERFETVIHTAAGLVRQDGSRGGRIGLLISQAQVSMARSLLPGFVWSAPVRVPLSATRVVLEGLRNSQ